MAGIGADRDCLSECGSLRSENRLGRAAVDEEVGALDLGGARRGEERDQVGDVFGLAVAAQAGSRELPSLVVRSGNPFGRGALVQQPVEPGGERHARVHGVDSDAVPEPELGERLGEVGERGVDSTTDHEARARRLGGGADHVDDCPLACLQQRPERP
jgi:hypothetical protein